MQNSIKNNERGFTLVELLIAMVISLVVLTSLSSAFISQRKTYDVQEQITEMIQSTRGAIDIISREVKMAGYDPTGVGIVGIPYSAGQLEIRADLNVDGDTADFNETIIYTENSGMIEREEGGNTVTLAENIQSFLFQYYDIDGNATTTAADIRQIDITIITQTSKLDPNYGPNNGYRTYTLSSYVTPPNLDF